MRIETLTIILDDGTPHELYFDPPIGATELATLTEWRFGHREKNPAPIPPTNGRRSMDDVIPPVSFRGTKP